MQLKWDYKKQAMEKENKSDKILFSKKFTQTNKKASFKWINPKGAVRVMKNANFLLRQCDQILPLRRNVALKIFGKLFWCLPIFWTYFGKIWCFGQIFIVLHGGQILKKIIKQSGHTFGPNFHCCKGKILKKAHSIHPVTLFSANKFCFHFFAFSWMKSGPIADRVQL